MAVGCGRVSIQSPNASVGNILFSGCSVCGLNVLKCALLPMAALNARSRSIAHWLCNVSDTYAKERNCPRVRKYLAAVRPIAAFPRCECHRLLL